MPAASRPARKTAAKKAAPRKAAPRKAPPPIVDEWDDDIIEDDDYADDVETVETEPDPAPADDVDDVPVELQFLSDTGERRDPEELPITINGERFTLTQPSDALLYMMSGSFISSAKAGEEYHAMQELVNVCIDPVGAMYLQRLIRSPDNSFDDQLIVNLAAVILERWASKIAENAELKNKPSKPANRAKRRQAARTK